MHAENIRTTKWKEHHERQKEKLEMTRQRFLAAQAREKRTAETYEARKIAAANKAVIAIRSAKNAVSSPTTSALPPSTIAPTEPCVAANGPTTAHNGVLLPKTQLTQ